MRTPRDSRTLAALSAVVVTMAGCASVRPQQDYEHTARHVEETTGQQTVYRPDEDELVANRVADLMAGGLTADEVAQIALLNNTKLQTLFFSIGMARADVVQSGLLSNPTLAMGLLFHDGGGVSRFGVDMAQNIADIWQIPARRSVAEQSLERAILETAREASVVVTDAKAAYYRVKQADRKLEIAADSVELSRQVLELALARQAAGAGSEVDVNLARSEVQDGELSLRTAALEAFEARSELAQLLTVTESPAELRLIEALPEVPSWTVGDDALFALANENRLDLRAAQCAVKSAEASVREEILKIFPTLEVGVGFERIEQGKRPDRDIAAASFISSLDAGQPKLQFVPREKVPTDTVLGPTLAMELPIFDQNQAGIARAQFAYQQSVRELDGFRVQILQDVRLANARARTACDVARYYREQVLPLRESSLALSRTAYQAGRTELINVLETERALLSARAGYVDSLKASVAAVVELERASGQPIAKILEAMPATGPVTEAPAGPVAVPEATSTNILEVQP
jgi:outer membrane protein, heavy metal efflux system